MRYRTLFIVAAAAAGILLIGGLIPIEGRVPDDVRIVISPTEVMSPNVYARMVRYVLLFLGIIAVAISLFKSRRFAWIIGVVTLIFIPLGYIVAERPLFHEPVVSVSTNSAQVRLDSDHQPSVRWNLLVAALGSLLLISNRFLWRKSQQQMDA